MKRVVIAAGGTGGHFYPGLVVAQALKAKGWEPLMVVKVGDPALPVLESLGLPALPVDLRGLPRRPGPELFSFALKLGAGMRLLSRALRSYRPDLVLGMGGYLTFPLIYAAWRRGLPRAVHESNSVLGLANAASVKLGADLFWGLPPAAPGAAGRLVGTPIRPELRARREAKESRLVLGLAPDRPTLLVFGGSQGAAALNAALPRAAKALPGVQVLHLAGRGKAAAAAAAYREEGATADVRDYLEDMGAAYGAADLVLSRAGASTLAELAAQRVPALLVPYPHATAGHQDVNARAFARAGAAALLPERSLQDGLSGSLRELLTSDGAGEQRARMSSRYASLGLPPAEATVDGFVTALEEVRAR